MNWIKVEDKLPEGFGGLRISNCVLTIDTSGYYEVLWYEHKYSAWMSREGQHKNITHWQPLPEPPKP